MVESLVAAARYGLGHLLHVAPTTLKQAMQIEARRVFNRAGKTLEAGKIRSEVGFEIRERRGNKR